MGGREEGGKGGVEGGGREVGGREEGGKGGMEGGRRRGGREGGSILNYMESTHQ